MGLSTLEPSARSMRLMSDYGTDAEEDAEKLRHEMVRGARVTFVDVDDQSTESDSESAICDYLDHSVHSMTRASTVASNRCTVGDNPHLSILTEADADVQNHGRSRSNSPVPQQHEETSSLRSSTPDSVGVSASVAPQGCDEDADQLSSPTPSECGSVRDLINLGGDGDTRSESPDAAADGGGGVRPHSPDGQDESVSALAVVDGNAVSGANPLRPGLDPGPVPPPRWMSASPAPDSPCSTSSFDILSRSSSPSSPFSSSSVVLITAESLPLFARENRPYLVASSGPEGPRSESSTPLLLSPVASSIDMPPSHLAFDRPLMRPPGVVDDRTEECSVSQCACESESVSVAETAPPAAGSRLSVHCRMCGRDPCEEVTATMCGHLFCKQCITEEVIAHSACPVCKHAVLLYCLFPIDLAI
ncbi:hypothetical protein CONPUDRAFT_146147 [Coniophora puteana RWD-64-598 SS2]|uniref:RING-type domain-containing protein n=1 Tax=Coniophora puteana (strain RWD-64-598) TaxID=741705 RepID=A0A5M3MEK4_CONPW|nr:uncharacterized protein CONPUDRAFT_146147 [Coniophora puteana RWD-64-598 SS2]EIW77035.1 hypothetical protein CONPUDRAFT_146147 [Coniophora puteana RWD-64-598 SS2]